MHSFDLEILLSLNKAGKFDELAEVLAHAALSLQSQGADVVLICSNTMHHVADAIEGAGVKLLHIVDATAERIIEDGRDEAKKVGLLGTRFTMETPFFTSRLKAKFGIEAIVPKKEDILLLENIIWGELGHGIVRDESRHVFKRVIGEMVAQGVKGIILGCTEIGILIKDGDLDVRMWDTAVVHAEAAGEWALR